MTTDCRFKGSAALGLIFIEQKQLLVKTFPTIVKKQKSKYCVKQVLNIDSAADEAPGSILHNHQFIIAS